MKLGTFVKSASLSTACAAILLTTACGGESSDRAPSQNGDDNQQETVRSASPVQPCHLLTQDEVGAAAGQPVLAGEPDEGSNPFGQTMCSWGAQRQGSVLVVQLSLMREADFAAGMKKTYSAEKLYEQAKTLYPAATDVDGVGLAAFRSETTLQVLLDDGVTFTVMIGLPGRHEVSDEALVGLARTVESRLK